MLLEIDFEVQERSNWMMSRPARRFVTAEAESRQRRPCLVVDKARCVAGWKQKLYRFVACGGACNAARSSDVQQEAKQYCQRAGF